MLPDVRADIQDDVDNTRAKVDALASAAYTAHRCVHAWRDDTHGGGGRVDAVPGVHAAGVLAVARARDGPVWHEGWGRSGLSGRGSCVSVR